MVHTSVSIDVRFNPSANDIAALQQLWLSCFPDVEIPPRPQFIKWLTRHTLDVCRYSFLQGSQSKSLAGADLLHTIRWVSKTMNATAREAL